MKKSIFFVCGLLVAISVNAHPGDADAPPHPHRSKPGVVHKLFPPIVIRGNASSLCYTGANSSCAISREVYIRRGDVCSCIDKRTGVETRGVAR